MAPCLPIEHELAAEMGSPINGLQGVGLSLGQIK